MCAHVHVHMCLHIYIFTHARTKTHFMYINTCTHKNTQKKWKLICKPDMRRGKCKRGAQMHNVFRTLKNIYTNTILPGMYIYMHIYAYIYVCNVCVCECVSMHMYTYTRTRSCVKITRSPQTGCSVQRIHRHAQTYI